MLDDIIRVGMPSPTRVARHAAPFYAERPT